MALRRRLAWEEECQGEDGISHFDCPAGLGGPPAAAAEPAPPAEVAGKGVGKEAKSNKQFLRQGGQRPTVPEQGVEIQPWNLPRNTQLSQRNKSRKQSIYRPSFRVGNFLLLFSGCPKSQARTKVDFSQYCGSHDPATHRGPS